MVVQRVDSICGLHSSVLPLKVGYKEPAGAPRFDEIEREVVQLYQENAAGLLRYALAVAGLRELAQDGVQESFLRFYVARLHGKRIVNANAWLYSVLRNYLLDRLKEHASKNWASLDDIKDLPDPRQDPERGTHQSEVSRQLLRSLAPRELECLRLRGEGLRYAEIAQILRIRSGTVGAMLARGLKKVRKAFGVVEGHSC